MSTSDDRVESRLTEEQRRRLRKVLSLLPAEVRGLDPHGYFWAVYSLNDGSFLATSPKGQWLEADYRKSKVTSKRDEDVVVLGSYPSVEEARAALRAWIDRQPYRSAYFNAFDKMHAEIKLLMDIEILGEILGSLSEDSYETPRVQWGPPTTVRLCRESSDQRQLNTSTP